MNEFAYPVQLVEEIKLGWNAAPAVDGFVLPDDRTLHFLLEMCYHASLRTTEHRPVRCVLAYAAPRSVPRKSLLLLEPPVPLTVGEIVRLSPITQLHRNLIGCDGSDGDLDIWGLFEHERAWVQLSAGEPPDVPMGEEDLPPHWLTIAIEQPGALSVARGSRGLVRLRDGRIIRPQEHPLRQEHEPLGMFFKDLVSDLLRLPGLQNQLQAAPVEHARRTLRDIYTTSIAAILAHIRSQRHGGGLVIARSPVDEALTQVTYRAARHASLSDHIVAYYEALATASQVPRGLSHQATELARHRAAEKLRLASQQLAAGINQVSLLTAIDGAVLLDGYLQIDGFGVRFPVQLPTGATVLDALTGVEYACDEWGLRHQSIFSLCQQCEDVVGLIVSQDGEVKAVKNVAGKLQLWGGILD